MSGATLAVAIAGTAGAPELVFLIFLKAPGLSQFLQVLPRFVSRYGAQGVAEVLAP